MSQKNQPQIVMDLSAMGIPTAKDSRLIRLDGASWAAEGIYDGDLLIVEEGRWRDGKLVAAVLAEGGTVGRCVRKSDRPALRRDADQPDPDLSTEQIIGEVVGLIRRM